MKASQFALLFLAATTPSLLAQSNSSSPNYDLLSAPPGVSGGQVRNGSTVTAEISIGDGFAGPVSDVTAGGVQETPNYIGQLYDVVAVAVNATPATIDELGTRQLNAVATLDDTTTLAIAAAEVQWSVVLGPLTGIDASGLATAGFVYEDTAATAEGSYQGVSGQLGLTVTNVDPDNFESYGGDGLDDGWQVGFFGQPPNADAAPGANPDHDPHNNEFEFLTGYDPTDSGSFFTLEVIDLAGATTTLELSKIIPGTRYRLERSADLEQSDPFAEITNFTTALEVLAHQLQDPNATGVRRFYRVGVERE